MTIATVRMTSSPMYDLNSMCVIHHIPYMHIQSTGIGRYGTPKKYVDTTLTPNKLVIVDSLSTLETYFESMTKQQVMWAVIVRGSELEAAEHGLAYTAITYHRWLLEALIYVGDPLVKFPHKTLSTNRNKSFLSQVLTDLYRIKPKEDRPFTPVFEYLAGKRGFPKSLPPYLVKSLKAAEPIRDAIKSLNGDYRIENIRKVSKAVRMDVFDINYTLAKTGLLPGKDDSK